MTDACSFTAAIAECAARVWHCPAGMFVVASKLANTRQLIFGYLVVETDPKRRYLWSLAIQ